MTALEAKNSLVDIKKADLLIANAFKRERLLNIQIILRLHRKVG